MKVTKYLAPPMNVVLRGPHMSEYIISRNLVTSLPPPLIRKRSTMLFVFNARFAKQQRYGAKQFAKVHVTHYVLECMNTFHVQMAKVAVTKRIISCWKLHQVGRIRFVHRRKNSYCTSCLRVI